MSKHLVIVESPTKIKTLKKYLNTKEYEVLASFGHVRDLIPKSGAVEPANNFAMHYQIIEKNAKHVDAICKAIKKADVLCLATDPDREGEAIAWNILEILGAKKNLLKNKKVVRVVFHEITKSALLKAFDSPRELSDHLVQAQQARRALDYLVGFNLSPLLWKKVRRGLSAGRVQSPALRMIVERQQEIDKFKAEEYWSISADLEEASKKFSAKLTHYAGDKLQQFSITNAKQADEIFKNLEQAANGSLIVHAVKKSKRKRNPTAPFITSTLQQEAVRKLGFSAQKAMRVAQQLYEGIDLGDGATGLITYMRTDSVHLSQEAINGLREFIANKYGKENLPDSPRAFKTKSKNAQEAHEAIRPTNFELEPEKVKRYLTNDQMRLYNLIWCRTIACQMLHATLNAVSIDFACKDESNLFRASGSVIANPGFMQVYLESTDNKDDEMQEKILPDLKVGDVVKLLKITPQQHFTEPPPRFSEASLVKALEEHGIGRPSTYASIISTLVSREYVTLDKKRFYPTDVGTIVNKFLTQYFMQYVDYEFTAKLEDDLDAIARGEAKMLPLLEKFWQPFDAKINDIEKNVQRSDVTQEKIDENCPKCSAPLSTRLGKRGKFIGCTAYPDCDYTRNLDGKEVQEPEVVPDRKCEKCGEALLIREGRYGKFIGCSGYPKCKFIESLNEKVEIDCKCPSCKVGNFVKKRSRYGSFFYACDKYPECRYAVNALPINEACPTCSWPILTLKTTKKTKAKVCPQKECDFNLPIAAED